MKNIFIYPILFLALFTSVSCTSQGITGEGFSITTDLHLDKITSIGLSLNADVVLTQGSPQTIRIEGQKNIIENIPTEVRNGNWEIGTKKNIRNYDKLKVYITLESLNGVAISGSGTIRTTNAFSSRDDFDLSISGSGDAAIDIKAKQLNCSISGSGTAALKGQAQTMSVSIAGSGDVKAYDLAVSTCDISTAGSGSTEVSVSEAINASIVGSGDVYYKGDPKLKVSAIGSGKVQRGI